MPPPVVVREVATNTDNHVVLVVIAGAAHAINFSHPDELAHVIRRFMADLPIVDDPRRPDLAHVEEVHRSPYHPATDEA